MKAPLAFITGASSGIGQALAARYAAAGYRLALVARRTAELDAWVQAQGLAPGRVAVYAADVRDIASITAAGRACVANQGLPEVVIASAGISVGVDTADFADLEQLRATFETNNLGMAATFQPFVQGMRERRSGTLVGVASVAGIRGLPGSEAYCASKSAAITYCESLRVDIAKAGVRVVTICPGFIRTPLTAKNPYWMPFLMDADAFAPRAADAIIANKSYTVIPWPMAIVAKLLRGLPNWAYDRLVAGRKQKPRSAAQ